MSSKTTSKVVSVNWLQNGNKWVKVFENLHQPLRRDVRLSERVIFCKMQEFPHNVIVTQTFTPYSIFSELCWVWSCMFLLCHVIRLFYHFLTYCFKFKICATNLSLNKSGRLHIISGEKKAAKFVAGIHIMILQVFSFFVCSPLSFL